MPPKRKAKKVAATPKKRAAAKAAGAPRRAKRPRVVIETLEAVSKDAVPILASAPTLASEAAAAPSARKVRVPWRNIAAFFALTFALVGAFGFVMSGATAATFQNPTQAPPGGNIPVTIWNRYSGLAKQTSAEINIDGNLASGGMTQLGASTLVLSGTQNLVYGNVSGSSVAGANLLLLQNASVNKLKVDKDGDVTAAGMSSFGATTLNLSAAQNLVYGNVAAASTGSLLLLQNNSADRFRVDAAGNATSSGKMNSTGCFGSTFVGLTTLTFGGAAATSYYGADNKCAAVFAGSHVCRVEEMLESISCSVASDPIRTNGGNVGWVNGGPPGYNAANANDCIGWTSAAALAFGRVWVFDNTTGGSGTLTSCNTAGLKYACCK